MINPSDFQAGELEATITKLKGFDKNDSELKETIEKYFAEFDSDHNDHLDRKELRQFLISFFQQYHIHAPLTDEYVDATFREIDTNHDNKIQPEELFTFASRFVKILIVAFEQAAASQNTKPPPRQSDVKLEPKVPPPNSSARRVKIELNEP